MCAPPISRRSPRRPTPRHLGAGRGYLHDSEQNHWLARMLRERPEDFGAASHIVLGADEVELFTEPGTFAGLVHIIGPECVDGMQRLKVIAHVAGELSREHLDRSVVRLEIVCGPERERARRVYDVAERYVNASTVQDGLIRAATSSGSWIATGRGTASSARAVG